MFYVDFSSTTYPNGFTALNSYTIQEVTEVPVSRITRQQYPVDQLDASYFTTRERAEIAAQYQINRNRGGASIYDGIHGRAYAADGRAAELKAQWDALR